MCLNFLDEFKIPVEDNEFVGYKSFVSLGENDLRSELAGDTRKQLPTNKWIKEVDYRVHKCGKTLNCEDRDWEGLFPQYNYGFHIFVKEEDAHSWAAGGLRNSMVIKKVKARNVVAKGRQKVADFYSAAVFVARQMLIVEEEDKNDRVNS